MAQFHETPAPLPLIHVLLTCLIRASSSPLPLPVSHLAAGAIALSPACLSLPMLPWSASRQSPPQYPALNPDVNEEWLSQEQRERQASKAQDLSRSASAASPPPPSVLSNAAALANQLPSLSVTKGDTLQPLVHAHEAQHRCAAACGGEQGRESYMRMVLMMRHRQQQQPQRQVVVQQQPCSDVWSEAVTFSDPRVGKSSLHASHFGGKSGGLQQQQQQHLWHLQQQHQQQRQQQHQHQQQQQQHQQQQRGSSQALISRDVLGGGSAAQQDTIVISDGDDELRAAAQAEGQGMHLSADALAEQPCFRDSGTAVLGSQQCADAPAGHIPAAPTIFAYIADQSRPAKELKDLKMCDAVSSAKDAIMRAFNLHPAKQSLMFEDARRQTCCWMHEGHLLSVYAAAAGGDFFIRVYASFELMMKFKERWLIVPSSACDTVLALKCKVAREIKWKVEEISLYLPPRGDAASHGEERELLHRHGTTLLSYGISSDLELRLAAPNLSSRPPNPLAAAAYRPPVTAAALHALPRPAAAPPQHQPSASAAVAHVNSATCTVMLGNFGDIKHTSFTIPAAALRPDGLFTLEAHLKFLHSHIQEKFNIHSFHQDIWHCGKCIISGLRCFQRPVDFSKVQLSDISVMRQFTLSIALNGTLHHVLASAHESVVDFRRKLCAVLDIDCSPLSPVLKISARVNDSHCKDIALKDDKLLLQYNIVNEAQLSIVCPASAVLAGNQPDAARRQRDLHQTARLAIGCPAAGAASDVVVVRILSSKPPDVKSFYLSEAGPQGLSVAALKQLIQVNIGVPCAMQTISLTVSGKVLGDDDQVLTRGVSVDCHVTEPAHLFIRLHLRDGTERMEKSGCSGRIKSFGYNVFFPRGALVVYSRPGDRKHGLILDCEPVFTLECRSYQPETPNHANRILLGVSPRLLLAHIKPMLCKSFSVPSDSGSLLCAQALPGLERGLVTLQGNKSFEAQGICRPAVCLCYWSPLPHVKLAVFVLARRKSVYSQTPRVAHITSLDESVQSFRLGLRALFAGEVPHRLVIAGADGAKIAMQDFAPLSQYQLLCFQVVTALFSQTMAEAAPAVPAERVAVLASGHHAPSPSPRGNIASESSGPACAAPAADLQPLLKCAGKNVTTFSKLLRGRHGAPIHWNRNPHSRAGCSAPLPLKNFSNSQLRRGEGQSHCYSCCGRRIASSSHFVSTESSCDLVTASCPMAAAMPPPSLLDFIDRVSSMDALCDAELQLQKPLGKTRPVAVPDECRIDSELDPHEDADDRLPEAEDADWNALFHAHHLQKRLVLLAEAAERCKSLRAWDLPPSASDAVVQLRVMGDYSITSEDDDGVDEKAAMLLKSKVATPPRKRSRNTEHASDVACAGCGRQIKIGRFCSAKCRFARPASTVHCPRRSRPPAAAATAHAPREEPAPPAPQHTAAKCESGDSPVASAAADNGDDEPLDAVANRILQRKAV